MENLQAFRVESLSIKQMATASANREEVLARFRGQFASRDYDEALASCRRLVELDPGDAVGWRNMGAVYIAMGRDREALEVSQRALELNPKDAYVYHNLGALSSRLGAHERAILHYQRAVELAPEMAEGHVGLAGSYYQLGDYVNALYYYSQAYQNAPDNPEIVRGFGVTLMHTGQLPKAVYYLRQALELRPDWPEARMELGESLRRMGEDRDAMTELLKALRMKQRPEGLVSLGRIHLKYGEPRKALVHLQQALKLGPRYAPAHHALGLVQAAIKSWPEAVRHLENAYRYSPDDPEIALDYAWAEVEAGKDLDHAYRLASAVRVKDPNQPRAFDVMGWCLHRQGKYAAAREELEKARTLVELKETPAPGDAVIYEHLAETYAALKDSMMSREMFSRALELDPGRREEWQKRQQK